MRIGDKENLFLYLRTSGKHCSRNVSKKSYLHIYFPHAIFMYCLSEKSNLELLLWLNILKCLNLGLRNNTRSMFWPSTPFWHVHPKASIIATLEPSSCSEMAQASKEAFLLQKGQRLLGEMGKQWPVKKDCLYFAKEVFHIHEHSWSEILSHRWER